MSNQINERVETLEQVTERLTEHSQTQDDRITNVENNIEKYPKVYFPDYAPQFQQIGEQLNTIITKQNDNKIDAALEQQNKRVEKLLRASPVRSQTRSLLIYFALVAFSAVCCGLAIGFRAEIGILNDLLEQKAVVANKADNATPQKTIIKSKATRKHSRVNHSSTKQ